MDIKQLFTDIKTFNLESFRLRWNKANAILKRQFILPFRKNFGTGKDLKQIPVIINNRNRYTYLLMLIEWLEKRELRNIYIIDNESTYPPLLKFYSTTGYKVFRLKENVGHLALWKSKIIDQFAGDYYIYTDPDILPVEDCPSDFLDFFMKNLRKRSDIEKIGFGLKIDDLPEHYSYKKKVIEWEKKFWQNEVAPGIYNAAIDTTFALYKPYTDGSKWFQNAYRTGGKYIARHLPWYENSSNPGEENIYYKEHVTEGASHWISNKS